MVKAGDVVREVDGGKTERQGRDGEEMVEVGGVERARGGEGRVRCGEVRARDDGERVMCGVVREVNCDEERVLRDDCEGKASLRILKKKVF